MRREWIQVCKIRRSVMVKSHNGMVMIYFQISRWNFPLNPKYEQNTNSKIRAQKMVESAIRCHWQINKSGVKISLWIRNLSKNVFKIRRSVGLFIRQWAFMRLRVCLTKAGQSLRTLRLYRIGGFMGGARGGRLLSFLGQTEARRAIKNLFRDPPVFSELVLT